MAYPGLAQEDHKYIGREFCTGYTDVYGKWNTGFYCPQYGSKTAVFCCGTAVYKYCCTNQEPVDPNSLSGVLLDGDDPDFDGGPHHGVSSAVFVRVPVVFGVVCGIAAVLVLLIVAACYFCSCCFAYKKRRNDHPHNGLPHHHNLNQLHLNHPVLPPPPNLAQSGLYRNSTQCNSTASSNLLNLYTGATNPGVLANNSLVTTPLDLDWASSLASYQPHQLFPPPSLQYNQAQGPGSALSPAATYAMALSQQTRPPSIPNSHVGGAGVPSIISGTTMTTSTGRVPSVSQAYQSILNSSTSTLSTGSGVVPPRNFLSAQPQLHRTNLPQQISTTASIVNSYLASLQQQPAAPSASEQHHHSAVVQPTLPPVVDRTRHPSPPPSYFQSVSSSSYHGGSNNNINYINNRNARAGNQNSQRQNRMAAIQSILAGGGSQTGAWSPEDDLLLADFLLRHENTLRRNLGVSNNTNNRTSNNNINSHQTTTANNNSRNRGNSMLTQRELIELLLRLTSNTAGVHSSASTGSSISRSDSRAGSDAHSTTSTATTRSTASAASTTSNGKVNPGQNCTKLTICEVDEDDNPIGSPRNNPTRCGSGPGVTMRNSKTTCLDLSLSRLSMGENDSGVASSTCSTVGSEVAEHVIGGIKMTSKDLSEEAIKLRKQPHAVDDDAIPDVKVVVVDEGNLTISNKMVEKLHEQQLAASIHPERNCDAIIKAGDSDECVSGGLFPTNNGGDGGDTRLKGNSKRAGYIGSGSDEEIMEIVQDRDKNGNSGCSSPPSSPQIVSTAATTVVPLLSNPVSSSAEPVLLGASETSISTTKPLVLPQV